MVEGELYAAIARGRLFGGLIGLIGMEKIDTKKSNRTKSSHGTGLSKPQFLL